jgi:hypothetical protein
MRAIKSPYDPVMLDELSHELTIELVGSRHARWYRTHHPLLDPDPHVVIRAYLASHGQIEVEPGVLARIER